MKDIMPKDTGTDIVNTNDNRYKILESLYTPSFSEDVHDFVYDLKLHYRLFKKKIKKVINRNREKSFTNIVYLTTDCPLYTPKSSRLDSPIDYISEMRKQYPDTNICLLIPIIGLSKDTKISKKMTIEIDDKFYQLEKTSVNVSVFAQNAPREGSLYKFAKNESNVTIFGIYSPDLSYLKNPDDLKAFDKRVLLAKLVRVIVRNLYKEGFKPEIVHSEFLPFFLGSEFESKFPENIKVFQVFNNFANSEADIQEPFWSIINIADKDGIKKLCNDANIQNCFSRLFSFPTKMIASKMQDFMTLVIDNYKMFHGTNTDEFENKGALIFKHLNDNTKKIFPNIIKKEDGCYYPLKSTILSSDYWAVYSETYYKDLYEKKLAPPQIMKEIMRTSIKSGYIQPNLNINNFNKQFGKIYNNFDSQNYREERIKNKKTLLKEFSSASIKTNFIDKTIFKDFTSAKIYGYLDLFYEAPLLFANPEADVYSEGVDILLNTILKLFERNRNIQIIVCIKNGFEQGYTKSVVDFLLGNNIFMGRWVFIDGEINLPKFLSASDMFLCPARICDKSVKHLLSMHYGCVPVVSNAGILNDSVIDIYDNISECNGFKLNQSLLYENEDTNLYINYLEKALEVYNNHSSWNMIIKNELLSNTGWSFEELEHYNQIYKNI